MDGLRDVTISFAGCQPSMQRRSRRVTAAFLSAMTFAVLAMSLAPTAAADVTADLRASVDGARGGCPALQPDPVLNDAAIRATSETQAYIEHTARFVPFEDPMPVLREMGYNAGKAKLVVGYGDSQDKAIRGISVLGWDTIPDCSYTKYGLSALYGARGDYVLTAVVLAGD
ncbi:MAG: hypothetical protein JWR48_3790 [Mycobacterium sp.]|jgi:hypothetical protein|nr:hypothetical protein [Mycobacterium sp.]